MTAPAIGPSRAVEVLHDRGHVRRRVGTGGPAGRGI